MGCNCGKKKQEFLAKIKEAEKAAGAERMRVITGANKIAEIKKENTMILSRIQFEAKQKLIMSIRGTK